MKNTIKAAGPISFIGLVILAVIAGAFTGLIPAGMQTMYQVMSAGLIVVLAVVVALANIQASEVVKALVSIIAISMGVVSFAALLVSTTLPFADVIGAILINLSAVFLTIGTIVGFVSLMKILKN